MNGVDPKAFEFALSKIEDGFIFEKFANQFLTCVLGYHFIPVGGLKDRGIDGLEHLFNRDGLERYIYQTSIEKNCKGKLIKTLETLKKNKIKFDRLYYVTNQIFPDIEKTIDELFEKYKKYITIFDLKWFSSNVNNSQCTINAYTIFLSHHLHEFQIPTKGYIVNDLVTDPRLFVFLRQQWDVNRKDLKLDQILADTLILYCLEGTDPDKGIFKTREQIIEDIATYIKFDPKLLHDTLNKRLDELSEKPRRITYHTKANGFCLPYETRLSIQERDLEEIAVYEKFKIDIETKLRSYLREKDIFIKDCVGLIESTFHRLFYKQGLEFANFVLHGENQEAFEKQLPDVISLVVDASSVIPKNKEAVKTSLLMTIRDIVYNGTKEQNLFLQRLSNTYMMLFLLQCDPKLCAFFSTIASRLNVFVCTSIIIPALSEIYLEPINRRHWNLLKGAKEAGVTLTINGVILHELISHFRMIIKIYEEEYRENEHLYLTDETGTLFIDEIMLRAYFYARMRNQVQNFNNFIDNFINYELSNPEEEMIEWLKEEFGIQYKSDKSFGIEIKKDEYDLLYSKLKDQKTHTAKARNDAKVILTIYAIREKNNETDNAGIFGYKTWWLSKDTVTQRTVNEVFKDKYRISCYIRPDFLYNYIALAPKKGEVDAAFRELFPSLLGVNISFHLPREITEFIRSCITAVR